MQNCNFILAILLEMSSVQVKTVVGILTWFLYTVTLVRTETEPRCNHHCAVMDAVNVEICLFGEEDIEFFSSCCPQCQWINSRNEWQGISFEWRVYPNSPHTYGQYNCVNQSNNNTMVRSVFAIPQS